MTPQRIQLKRTKGWRMPENTVKVDRTTKYGNPFKVGVYVCDWIDGEYVQTKVSDAERSVSDFRKMLRYNNRNYPSTVEIQAELAGKNLACWCKAGAPCHADALLIVANSAINGAQ